MRFPVALMLGSLLVLFSGTRTDAAQWAVPGCGGWASSALDAEARFIECAREGTSKYTDRTAAILDGYRRIGSDFPAMGEHWINLALLFDREVDPRQPEVLSYIEVDDEPRLIGVAYALPLLAGETPPDWPATDAWHDHYRTLDDETALPGHHGSDDARDRARIAMLHAWIFSDNPAGPFAADNWAIPYLRAGLAAPQGAPENAARALALISGGTDHFLASIVQANPPPDSGKTRIEDAFRRAEIGVGRVVEGLSSGNMTLAEAAQLSGVWIRLWDEIEASAADR